MLTFIQNRKRKKVFNNIEKVIKDINKEKESLQVLSDDELRSKALNIKNFIQQKGSFEHKDIVQTFALAREISRRVKNMEHYDVQLIGGLILIDKNIAEMRTGEGKTLVATLPAIMYGMLGKGVHVVTVNEYLAKRDAELMRPIYEGMGLSVGVVLRDMPKEEKRAMYACDITYSTSNELGFDYLRDNMVTDLSEKVQREPFFALIDEVDSVLIDEARTPLIISGEANDTEEVARVAHFVFHNPSPLEKNVHYEVNLGHHEVFFTEEGYNELERRFENFEVSQSKDLYHGSNLFWHHFMINALKAHELYQKNIEYVVQNGEIVIVDENTGRIMKGRRWSHGIHQAIEVKENVKVKKESKTLATISLQNYFKHYQHLAGMTGTAMTEAEEFEMIYGLNVIPVPTHKPIARVDHHDMVYKTMDAKINSIVAEIEKRHAKLQPILLGTNSVEWSEKFAQILLSKGIPFNVLNAKEHEKEAFIIEQAGRPGAITIATNMAGRGTDIILGGNIESMLHAIDENDALQESDKVMVKKQLQEQWKKDRETVIQAGGLHVLGTERNPSRRVDNQLRGRSGRQGDIGSSQFFVSMDDDMMLRFGGEKIKVWMTRLGLRDNDVIENTQMSKQIEKAQRQMEGLNFDSRKNMLSFDNVLNEQRAVIYKERDSILQNEELQSYWDLWADEKIHELVYTYMPPQTFEEQWDFHGLDNSILNQFHVLIESKKILEGNPTWDQVGLIGYVTEQVARHFNTIKEAHPMWNHFAKLTLLQTLDNEWQEHLELLDALREGIHLRSYAQKKPQDEYKRDSFELFKSTVDRIRSGWLEIITNPEYLTVASDENETTEEAIAPVSENGEYKLFSGSLDDYDDEALENEEHSESLSSEKSQPKFFYAPWKVTNAYVTKNLPNRNALCPCNSGQKYKACHGKI